MRVIKTVGSDRDNWLPCLRTHQGQPYAILSHRWTPNPNHEILFADVDEIDEFEIASSTTIVKNALYSGVDPRDKPAFKKLRGAAQQAFAAGYEYIWIDTCCIDKNSSAELSEAINSMWMWYKSSGICLVYLADVRGASEVLTKASFAASQWWTRGWTLQELLAPTQLTFYSCEWIEIGKKRDMDLTIREITRIDANVINGTLPLTSICIAQRMSWASSRTTTRPEDLAYCLLGIFGVTMPLVYGDGERAFIRLQEEIIKGSDDETIFAWRDNAFTPGTYSGLLALRPSAFHDSRNVIRYDNSEGKDLYSMTNKGMSLTLREIYKLDQTECHYVALFHCANPPTRQRFIGIYLIKISDESEQYARVRCQEWAFKPINYSSRLIPSTIYVRQFHDQQPIHSELDPVENRIRLLQVIPSENPSVIKLRLVEADIRTSRYTAISQHCGEDYETQTIWVNDKPFEIAESAFRFLQKACEDLSDDLFWMYLICVQLGDDRERSHHVTLYPEIFTYASRVVAWLGAVDTDYNQLRQLLAAVITTDPDDQTYWAHVGPNTGLEDAFTTNLGAIEKIAMHAYWSRAWIVQEILSAREVVIDLDKFSITIEELTCIYHMITAKVGRTHTSHMGKLLDFYQARGTQPASYYDLLNYKPCALRTASYTLEDLLDTFKHQKCEDVRDRIYAYANLSELGGKLRFDYDKSPPDIFVDVATCLGSKLTFTALSILVLTLQLGVDSLRTQSLYSIEHGTENDESHADLQHVFYYKPCPNLGKKLSIKPAIEPSQISAMLPSHIDVTSLFGIHGKDRRYGVVFGLHLQSKDPIYRPVCLYQDAGHYYCLGAAFINEIEQALCQTSAIEENYDGGENLLRIRSDNLGLLALGICCRDR